MRHFVLKQGHSPSFLIFSSIKNFLLIEEWKNAARFGEFPHMRYLESRNK